MTNTGLELPSENALWVLEKISEARRAASGGPYEGRLTELLEEAIENELYDPFLTRDTMRLLDAGAWRSVRRAMELALGA